MREQKRKNMHEGVQKRRSNRYRKAKNKRRRAIFNVVFSICTGFLITYSLTIFFKVTNVQIEGSTIYNSSDVLENLSIKTNDSLIFFDKNSVKNEILTNLPYVETVSIRRQYPTDLLIEVTEYEDFFAVYNEDKYYSLSENGKVLSEITRSETENLIKLVGIDFVDFKIGQTIKTDDEYKVYALFNILENFSNYIDIITEINLTKNYDIVIQCGTKYKIEVGNAEDLSQKVKMFEEVLKKITPFDTVIINLGDKSIARFRNEMITKMSFP